MRNIIIIQKIQIVFIEFFLLNFMIWTARYDSPPQAGNHNVSKSVSSGWLPRSRRRFTRIKKYPDHYFSPGQSAFNIILFSDTYVNVNPLFCIMDNLNFLFRQVFVIHN